MKRISLQVAGCRDGPGGETAKDAKNAKGEVERGNGQVKRSELRSTVFSLRSSVSRPRSPVSRLRVASYEREERGRNDFRYQIAEVRSEKGSATVTRHELRSSVFSLQSSAHGLQSPVLSPPSSVLSPPSSVLSPQSSVLSLQSSVLSLRSPVSVVAALLVVAGWALAQPAQSQAPVFKYYVWGQVRSPGAISLGGNPDLMELLSAAGGPTEYADVMHVVLVRATTQQRMKVNLKKMLYAGQVVPLSPGDVVMVPNSPWYRIREGFSIVTTVTSMATLVLVIMNGVGK